MSGGDTDRLVLDVTVVENSREEEPEHFEQYLTDMFISVYDETEFNVTETDADE